MNPVYYLPMPIKPEFKQFYPAVVPLDVPDVEDSPRAINMSFLATDAEWKYFLSLLPRDRRSRFQLLVKLLEQVHQLEE